MEHMLIPGLQDKDLVDGYLLIKEKTVSVGKNGRPFMALIVGNKTGQLDGRVWDRVEQISSEFEVGDIVKIKGAIQIFQGRKQLVIHKIDKSENTDISIDDFIPEGNVPPEDLFAQLRSLVMTMENPHLQQLILDSIDDSEVKKLMLKAPAAKTIHHAWRGGLLEHVLSILKIMDFFASHYKNLNRDLLFFGAIFHDLGKIWELSFDDVFAYTDEGRLLGHMELACELIDKKSSRILGFPDELRVICKHIVLSHHGRLDYGSPKRPKFLEAMLVAMVDDLDSKMVTIQTFLELERQSGQKWSRYNDLFERYFLLDDLKEKFK